jgi:DNA-binding transcriptional LysR family regulator
MQETNFYYKANRLQQVRGFINVVDHGGITEAAKAMGVAKSTLSAQVKSLERDLNTKLIRKVGSHVTTTLYGQKFYEIAIPHLQGMESLYERFFTLKDEDMFMVRVASHHFGLCHILPVPIRETIKTDNRIKFDLISSSRPDAVEMLKKREIDLAIYPIALSDLPTNDTVMQYIPLIDYDPILIMPKNHELCTINDANLTAQDIFKHNSILATSDVVSKNIAKSMKGNISINIPNMDVVMSLVEQNLGHSAIHRGYINEWNAKNISYKSLAHIFPKTKFFIIKRYQENEKQSLVEATKQILISTQIRKTSLKS